jgi:hypothetical protein
MPLYQGARTGTNVKTSGGFFDILAADVASGQRPTSERVLDRRAQGVHRASGVARRLRLHVGFDANPVTLNLAFKNHGRLGVHLQAPSLTVAGAP